MESVHDALRAGHAAPPPAARPAALGATLVVGAGGALGSAVLEHLLRQHRPGPLRVLATRRFQVAMQGLEAVAAPAALFDAVEAGVDGSDALAAPPSPTAARTRRAPTRLAIVVFDAARRSNGREEAYARPDPARLPALARWLASDGVRDLVVVLPHRPAALPQALRAGLANLDEHAVAGLGFDHLVFVRSADPSGTARAERWLQRVADGVLAQLRFMVPVAQQAVRVKKVAEFVAALARRLPASPPGTRVAPPELLWQAAQVRDCGGLVDTWLAGGELPALAAPRPRL